MSDKNDKFEESVPGNYFVVRERIACDACTLGAPIKVPPITLVWVKGVNHLKRQRV